MVYKALLLHLASQFLSVVWAETLVVVDVAICDTVVIDLTSSTWLPDKDYHSIVEMLQTKRFVSYLLRIVSFP